MYRAIKYGILGVATFMLFLHNFIPHVHEHSEFSAHSDFFSTPSSGSFYDLLRQAVSQDMGKHHLENFSIEKKENKIHTVKEINLACSFLKPSEQKVFSTSSNKPQILPFYTEITKKPYLVIRSMRAPPGCS